MKTDRSLLFTYLTLILAYLIIIAVLILHSTKEAVKTHKKGKQLTEQEIINFEKLSEL